MPSPRFHVARRKPLLHGTNLFQGNGRKIDLWNGMTCPFQVDNFRQVRRHSGSNHDSIKLRLTKSPQGGFQFLCDHVVHGPQFGLRRGRFGQEQIFQANGPEFETLGV